MPEGKLDHHRSRHIQLLQYWNSHITTLIRQVGLSNERGVCASATPHLWGLLSVCVCVCVCVCVWTDGVSDLLGHAPKSPPPLAHKPGNVCALQQTQSWRTVSLHSSRAAEQQVSCSLLPSFHLKFACAGHVAGRIEVKHWARALVALWMPINHLTDSLAFRLHQSCRAAQQLIKAAHASPAVMDHRVKTVLYCPIMDNSE